MLLSRFWYVILGLLLGLASILLYLATSMYNRAGSRALAESLSADSQVVSWYLKDDARQRSAQLIKFALDGEITRQLQKASGAAEVSNTVRDSALAALRKVKSKVPPEYGFDAVFAVDRHGRVVARLGFEHADNDLNIGGYPVVADALHGYLRDDTLIMDRIYRVVARPVEAEIGAAPVGAIVGARLLDDSFAKELSERTGAAIAFYARGQRAASAAPPGFESGQLDQIVRDLGSLDQDKDYQERGRSSVRVLGDALSVQYARLLGEAWALGAGYAVARAPGKVASPLGFLSLADDKDKESVSVVFVLLVVLAGAGIGGIFSVLEHTRPLHVFRREAQKLAKGEIDQLQPSKFRGVYRKIAADMNDGIDRALAKGGQSTRAADLTEVLGDLAGQPAMSAFSFPGDAPESASPMGIAALVGPGAPVAPQPKRALPVAPRSPLADRASEETDDDGMGRGVDEGRNPLEATLPATGMRVPPAPRRPASDSVEGSEGQPEPAVPQQAQPAAPEQSEAAGPPRNEPRNEEDEWQQVYQEFLATKQQCGEKTSGFTYEKFEATLRKNRDSLVQRHGATRVRFSVYVKDGRAALKASPLRDA